MNQKSIKKTKCKFLVAFLLFMLVLPLSSALINPVYASWWNTDWDSKESVKILGADGAGTDYQMKFTVRVGEQYIPVSDEHKSFSAPNFPQSLYEEDYLFPGGYIIVPVQSVDDDVRAFVYQVPTGEELMNSKIDDDPLPTDNHCTPTVWHMTDPNIYVAGYGSHAHNGEFKIAYTEDKMETWSSYVFPSSLGSNFTYTNLFQLVGDNYLYLMIRRSQNETIGKTWEIYSTANPMNPAAWFYVDTFIDTRVAGQEYVPYAFPRVVNNGTRVLVPWLNMNGTGSPNQYPEEIHAVWTDDMVNWYDLSNNSVTLPMDFGDGEFYDFNSEVGKDALEVQIRGISGENIGDKFWFTVNFQQGYHDNLPLFEATLGGAVVRHNITEVDQYECSSYSVFYDEVVQTVDVYPSLYGPLTRYTYDIASDTATLVGKYYPPMRWDDHGVFTEEVYGLRNAVRANYKKGYDENVGYQYHAIITDEAGVDFEDVMYVDADKVQADFDDIRFISYDDSTELDYWMETYVENTYAVFWVKIAANLTITEDVSIMYIYYENDGVSTTSSASNTWIYFNNFNESYALSMRDTAIGGTQGGSWAHAYSQSGGTNTYYPGMQGWWHFNSWSGAVAYDYAPPADHGALTEMGNDNWITGKYSNALSFDGINETVKVDDSASMSVTDNLTISFWLKLDDIDAGWRYWVSKEWDYYVATYSDDLYFGVKNSTSDSTYLKATAVLTADDWYHITCKYRSGSALYGQNIWIDGVQNIYGPTYGLLIDGATDLYFGSANGASDFAKGTMDEVRIFNRALEGDESGYICVDDAAKAGRPDDSAGMDTLYTTFYQTLEGDYRLRVGLEGWSVATGSSYLYQKIGITENAEAPVDWGEKTDFSDSDSSWDLRYGYGEQDIFYEDLAAATTYYLVISTHDNSTSTSSNLQVDFLAIGKYNDPEPEFKSFGNFDITISNIELDNWVFAEEKYYHFEAVYFHSDGTSNIDTTKIKFTDGVDWITASYDVVTNNFNLESGGEKVTLHGEGTVSSSSIYLTVSFDIFFTSQVLDSKNIDIWMYSTTTTGYTDGWEIIVTDYFHIYNLGGYAEYTFTDYGGKTTGGDVFEIWAGQEGFTELRTDNFETMPDTSDYYEGFGGGLETWNLYTPSSDVSIEIIDVVNPQGEPWYRAVWLSDATDTENLYAAMYHYYTPINDGMLYWTVFYNPASTTEELSLGLTNSEDGGVGGPWVYFANNSRIYYINSTDDHIEIKNGYTMGAWHNCTFAVNVTAQAYDFWFDGVRLADDVEYYSPRTAFNLVIITTHIGTSPNSDGITYGWIDDSHIWRSDLEGDASGGEGGVGGEAEVTLTFRRLQHVHSLFAVGLPYADEGLDDVGEWYVEWGIDYCINDVWIENAWKVRIEPYNADVVGCDFGTKGQNWIQLKASWYKQDVLIKTDYFFTFWEGGPGGLTVSGGEANYFRLYLDLWFNKINASSTVGGRVSSYYYGMSDKANPYFQWWTGSDWRIMGSSRAQTSYFTDLEDGDGKIHSFKEISLMRIRAKVNRTANYDYAVRLEQFELLSYKFASNAIIGIDTPIPTEARIPTMPSGGFLGALSIGFSNILKVLTESIGPRLFEVWDIYVGFMDEIFASIGYPDLFSNLTGGLADFAVIFGESMIKMYELIIPLFEFIGVVFDWAVSFVTGFLDFMIVFIEVIEGIMDGTYGLVEGVSELTEFIEFEGMGTFIFLMVFVTWMGSIDARALRARGSGVGWMNIAGKDLTQIMAVSSFIISIFTTVVNLVLNIVGKILSAIPF